jgi:ABC-type glycerol-3-phosphate transport system permease component
MQPHNGEDLRNRLSLSRILMYGILVTGVLVAITPFLWMLSYSFMTRGEMIRRLLLPSRIQWGNYIDAWKEANFGHYFRNSILISSVQVLFSLLFCTMASYAFARIRFRGNNILFFAVLATMMIPESVVLIPNFMTVSWLHRHTPFSWINNWPALTVPFMANGLSIFLLRQFFATIPDEYWDAARIDGAGHFRFLRQIVVPLSKAPILTVCMFVFIGSWNALAWPLLVTNNPTWRPISVGLQQFVSEAGPEIHLQMAGAVIAIVPVLLVYFFIQKEFTEGIVITGLKG